MASIDPGNCYVISLRAAGRQDFVGWAHRQGPKAKIVADPISIEVRVPLAVFAIIIVLGPACLVEISDPPG